MKTKINLLSIPIAPILAGLVPVMYLAASNIDQIDRQDITRSVLFGLALGVAALFFLRLILRSWSKASILGAVYLLLFFSYGHAYQWLEIQKSILGHHSVLLVLFGVIAVAITWIIFRSGEVLSTLLIPLNVILMALLLYSTIPVAVNLMQYESILRTRKEEPKSGQNDLPDVYFIILDAYARKDVLESEFGFDNSAFLERLEQLGFSVLDCNQSNYQITMISLFSTLSMDYVSEVPGSASTSGISSDILIKRGKFVHNPVRSTLEELGYTTVAFDSAYPWSKTPDVDHYFKVDLNKQYSVLNKFESILINSSMGIVYTDHLRRNASAAGKGSRDLNMFDESPEFFYMVHQNTLDRLDGISSMESPKYVYAHIGAPHDPYVLARDGSYVGNQAQTGDPYINQLIYINNRMTSILEKILRGSKTPPIIVLESDHGYDPEDKDSRLKNLMAFYVPEEIRSHLYPTMTPVNSFRLVLNYLDGGNRPLLPDYSFFSPEFGKQDFEVIPNTCKAQ